jgi:hypothetical protein
MHPEAGKVGGKWSTGLSVGTSRLVVTRGRRPALGQGLTWGALGREEYGGLDWGRGPTQCPSFGQRGWLRYCEERGKRMSREAGPGVGVVRSVRMLRAIPQEHMSVSGGKVRCREHVDRVRVGVCLRDRLSCSMVSSWSSSGLRVLAAHDHA